MGPRGAVTSRGGSAWPGDPGAASLPRKADVRSADAWRLGASGGVWGPFSTRRAVRASGGIWGPPPPRLPCPCPQRGLWQGREPPAGAGWAGCVEAETQEAARSPARPARASGTRCSGPGVSQPPSPHGGVRRSSALGQTRCHRNYCSVVTAERGARPSAPRAPRRPRHPDRGAGAPASGKSSRCLSGKRVSGGFSCRHSLADYSFFSICCSLKVFFIMNGC